MIYDDGKITPVISLRNQFAMAALTGLIADARAAYNNDELVKYSFGIADAMMKVREEK